MASSIDWGTVALGALIGVGCRKQLKSAARVAAVTAATIAGAAATAAAQVAQETSQKSPEAAAAEAWTARVNQNIDQQVAGQGN